VNAIAWVLVVLLIFGNALFVAAEFALTSVDRTKLQRLAEDGSHRAQHVFRAVEDLSFQLSGAQLGITVCSLLLGFVAEPVIADALRPLADGTGLPPDAAEVAAAVTALLLATVIQMLFGELVPQNLAISRPLVIALAITPWQRRFSWALRPVIAVFNNTANGLVRRLGVEPREELRAGRTPAELSFLIGSSAREGTLPAELASLLRRTLDFRDRTAGDVMTPRVQVDWLDARQTAADLLHTARHTGHSRFPVHSGNVDDIVGVAHVKHALAVPRADRSVTALAALAVEAVRVPETLHCDQLMPMLRGFGLQLAVVVDEYGGTAGVVTMEDLVEELIGQVRDEHDTAERRDVIALTDGGWSVSGLLRRDELQQQLGFTPPAGPFDTLAGLILSEHGHVRQVERNRSAHCGERERFPAVTVLRLADRPVAVTRSRNAGDRRDHVGQGEASQPQDSHDRDRQGDGRLDERSRHPHEAQRGEDEGHHPWVATIRRRGSRPSGRNCHGSAHVPHQRDHRGLLSRSGPRANRRWRR
jgi:CBS domain containing-hemolysin-like protein